MKDRLALRLENRHSPCRTVTDTYAQGMAPKVLLPCEPLATGLAGVRPLTSVRSDMPLEDALLLGSVRAERTLVELDGNHQHVTWGIQ